MSPNGRRNRVTAVPVTKQARRSIANRPKVVGLVHKFRSRLKMRSWRCPKGVNIG